MTKEQAQKAETTFRATGWDVTAQQSPIGSIGWELKGSAADGGRPVYGFAASDMKILVLGGQVARLPAVTP